MHDIENWRPIPGHDFYEVSDHGRVRSLDRRISHQRYGTVQRKGVNLILSLDKDGYQLAGIGSKPNRITVRVHAVVASVFIGERPSGHEVNHKNGIKTDNRPSNLEWVTTEQNNKHALDTGLNGFDGETNPRSILTDAQVQEIRASYRPRVVTIASLAGQFNVSPSTIQAIVSGKTWRAA